jgi:hypothetical protein
MERRSTGKRTFFGSTAIPLIIIILAIVALLSYDKESNSIFGYNLDEIWKSDVKYEKNSIIKDKPKSETLEVKIVSYTDIQKERLMNGINSLKDTIIVNDSVIYIKQIVH